MVRKEGTHTVRWGKGGGAPLLGTLESIVKNAATIPGPGQYELDRNRSVSVTKFGSNAGKTYLDEVVYLKRDVPGPNSYPVNLSSLTQMKGGRFSTGHVPSFSDAVARQSIGPGPGKYMPPLQAQPKGGKWGPKHSTSAPSALDMAVRRAADTPAPGAYGIIVLHSSTGGRFGPPPAEREKREASWRIPGPQHYGVLPVQGVGPRVIKIGGIKTKSDVDVLCDIARKVPGPGAYNIEPGYEKSTFSHKDKKEVFEWEEQPATESPIRKEELLVGGTAEDAVSILSRRYKEVVDSVGISSGRARAVYSRAASTKHMVGDFSECTDPIPKMRFSY